MLYNISYPNFEICSHHIYTEKKIKIIKREMLYSIFFLQWLPFTNVKNMYLTIKNLVHICVQRLRANHEDKILPVNELNHHINTFTSKLLPVKIAGS